MILHGQIGVSGHTAIVVLLTERTPEITLPSLPQQTLLGSMELLFAERRLMLRCGRTKLILPDLYAYNSSL